MSTSVISSQSIEIINESRIESSPLPGNPAYPDIYEELNRYDYEGIVEIDGEPEPIHGGKIKKQNTD